MTLSQPMSQNITRRMRRTLSGSAGSGLRHMPFEMKEPAISILYIVKSDDVTFPECLLPISCFVHIFLAPQFRSLFANYEIHHEHYSRQPSYPTYPFRSDCGQPSFDNVLNDAELICSTKNRIYRSEIQTSHQPRHIRQHTGLILQTQLMFIPTMPRPWVVKMHDQAAASLEIPMSALRQQSSCKIFKKRLDHFKFGEAID